MPSLAARLDACATCHKSVWVSYSTPHAAEFELICVACFLREIATLTKDDIVEILPLAKGQLLDIQRRRRQSLN